MLISKSLGNIIFHQNAMFFYKCNIIDLLCKLQIHNIYMNLHKSIHHLNIHQYNQNDSYNVLIISDLFCISNLNQNSIYYIAH